MAVLSSQYAVYHKYYITENVLSPPDEVSQMDLLDMCMLCTAGGVLQRQAALLSRGNDM